MLPSLTKTAVVGNVTMCKRCGVALRPHRTGSVEEPATDRSNTKFVSSYTTELVAMAVPKRHTGKIAVGGILWKTQRGRDGVVSPLIRTCAMKAFVRLVWDSQPQSASLSAVCISVCIQRWLRCVLQLYCRSRLWALLKLAKGKPMTGLQLKLLSPSKVVGGSPNGSPHVVAWARANTFWLNTPPAATLLSASLYGLGSTRNIPCMSAKYSAKSANRTCAASKDVLYGRGNGVLFVQFAMEPQVAA